VVDKNVFFRTSHIAAEVGVHPNTVRMYEQWGFLQAVPRGANGYRLYEEAHLDQMRLARTALHGGWPGRAIRRSALSLVRLAASGDTGGALEQAHRHVTLVRGERDQAEAAAAFLESRARGGRVDATQGPMSIGVTAEKLALTVDTLRSWERNRLLKPPRNSSGYRVYGPLEIGRLRVIRMLYLAGYGTMAILRLMSSLDSGEGGDALQILDTPRPDEDVYSASDRWLSALEEHERRALAMISLLEEIAQKHSG
jgi:DNA-binding transcriptional MerR regulator